MAASESFGRALDTTPEASEVQAASWRMMTAREKADLVAALSRVTRELAERGIRARHPDASEREVFLRLAILQLGRELAVQAYPDAAHFVS
jgi:hypothetical protein